MVHEVGPTTAEVHHEQRNQEPLDGKVFAFAPRDAQPKGDLVGERDRGELGGFNGVFNGVFSLVFQWCSPFSGQVFVQRHGGLFFEVNIYHWNCHSFRSNSNQSW